MAKIKNHQKNDKGNKIKNNDYKIIFKEVRHTTPPIISFPLLYYEREYFIMPILNINDILNYVHHEFPF